MSDFKKSVNLTSRAGLIYSSILNSLLSVQTIPFCTLIKCIISSLSNKTMLKVGYKSTIFIIFTGSIAPCLGACVLKTDMCDIHFRWNGLIYASDINNLNITLKFFAGKK